MEVRKKSTFKKTFLYWLLADLVIVVSVFILLLHKPSGYNPVRVAVAAGRRQVSPYLTHQLMPQLYNGAQLAEPFELVITQQGINGIIANAEWPRNLDNVTFSSPNVLFLPCRVVLMGTVSVNGLKFIVTIITEPKLDKDGLLNLSVASVKLGAVNITFIARALARKAYSERVSIDDIDSDDLRAKMSASLLNNEPFEPVFEVDDKKIKMKRIAIRDKRVVIGFVPYF